DPRVVDFYRQLPPADPARSDPFHAAPKNLFQLGPSGIQRVVRARWTAGQEAVIALEIAWQTREPGRQQGETLLAEERIYRLASRGPCTVVDLFSRLMQSERPVTLLPENDHGYIGVRVHDLIDVEDGGRMVDSEGRVNPTEHFRDDAGDRRIPRWVDCTGRIGPSVFGIALMSHPANLRNEWYLREFGLMIISAAQSQPVRITTESPFEYAARFVAHDGKLSSGAADQLHAEFGGVTMAALKSLVKRP
ncbi:MAG: PmoA family protein, partial [Planctomycetes bacterium]|nr:PmoA family protein [Planctomycetota bacterium]